MVHSNVPEVIQCKGRRNLAAHFPNVVVNCVLPHSYALFAYTHMQCDPNVCTYAPNANIVGIIMFIMRHCLLSTVNTGFPVIYINTPNVWSALFKYY